MRNLFLLYLLTDITAKVREKKNAPKNNVTSTVLRSYFLLVDSVYVVVYDLFEVSMGKLLVTCSVMVIASSFLCVYAI